MSIKKEIQARNVLRVALYLRVSTQEQAKEGYSIGEQEERLKKYCEAMGWDIYKIYIDPGYSGGDTNRPGLQTMIDDVKENKVDKVVVYKLDRLSRSQLDTLFLIEKVFLANNTDFVSMSENFDTSTPFGRAMIGILAVFAQLEREQIKERMSMGKEARAKEGKWNGGSSVPIGYRYDSLADLLILDEWEAMQIEELKDLSLPFRGSSNQRIIDVELNKFHW
jgi:site-specific DNA recombinase